MGAVILPDEDGPISDIVRDLIRDLEIHAPAHWPAEVANMLVVAIRRARLDPAQRPRALTAADTIVRGATLYSAPVITTLAALAEEHRLTAYDAAYLALAKRLACPLATTDKALNRAARSNGVELLLP